MRTETRPRGTFRTLVLAWQRIADMLCARRSYQSRPNVSAAKRSTLLPALIEALAPLGMPDVQHHSNRAYGGAWVRRARAAVYAAVSWGRSTVLTLALVLVIHLAAIRCLVLSVGKL
jgi:hypothetical protein